MGDRIGKLGLRPFDFSRDSITQRTIIRPKYWGVGGQQLDGKVPGDVLSCGEEVGRARRKRLVRNSFGWNMIIYYLKKNGGEFESMQCQDRERE